ncbi:MAG: S24 family peptidase [Pseudomonadota bacterium]|jgi:transcriptional regulator with XRE-family HTH domain
MHIKSRAHERSATDTKSFRKQFAANFNAALDRAGVPKAGQGRVARVGEMFRVSKATAQKWVAGTTIPDTYRFHEIAQRLGCSIGQLYYGFGEQSEELSEVGFISKEQKATVRISQDLIRRLNWPPGTLLLEVRDNTMEPFVIAGDLVIADSSVRDLAANGVYVLYHRGRYAVRRVQALLGGRARMICDNKRYSPEDIPLGPGESPDVVRDDAGVYVVGLVIGRILLSR